MIVGNGILAKSLQQIDREEVLFFASGVSNSLETQESEFLREKQLLEKILKENPDKKLVYFSTCSIYDPTKENTAYVKHKLDMENHIANGNNPYVIFRVGNAVGKGGNPNTLINFLKNSIENKNTILVYHKAKRILIGTEDISHFIEKNLDNYINEIVDLTYPYQYTIEEIIQALQKYLGTFANLEWVDKGEAYNMEFSPELRDFFKPYNPKEYLEHLFKTYL